MAEQALHRASALDGCYVKGHHGVEGSGVSMAEVPDLTLWQVAAWADTVDTVAMKLAADCGVSGAPGFCMASGDHKRALLRVEPLKFWVFGAANVLAADNSADANEFVSLDLSHSRTHLRFSGEQATTVLNRFLPLDLRDKSFVLNSVASSAIHHVGVTLWRSELGYELFVPRGFAVSVWELLFESALQYGVEVG